MKATIGQLASTIQSLVDQATVSGYNTVLNNAH